MKNLKLFFLLLCLSSASLAQDSTKTFNHEIGFNTVSLIKQLISNDPGSVLDQLPYDIFYNIYYKDKFGIRLGLGVSNFKAETTIEGQPTPRKSTQNLINLRAGLSDNFVKHNRLTLNAFVDGIYSQSKLESVNTRSTQTGPNTSITITTTSSDKVSATGGQVGVGVKYNLYKHLSIYAEVPLTLLSQTVSSSVLVKEPNQPDEKSSSKSKNTSVQITVPATLYLVLRF